MKPWTLFDYIDPVEDEDQIPRTPIHSEEELRAALDQLRDRRPGVVLLASPQDEYLEVAIGGPVAALQWSKPPVSRHLKAAIRVGPLCAYPVQFSNQGLPTHFETRDLLAVQEVLEAVIFFYKNQRLPEEMRWRVWNPAAKVWEMSPLNGELLSSGQIAEETMRV